MPATDSAFPDKSRLTIGFAHHAYQLKEVFARRDADGIDHFHAYTRDELLERAPEADVLVVSGLWQEEILDRAPRLRWIQSVGAGYDQFPLDRLQALGIRLTRAYGVNREAVAEHTFACILSLSRHLHLLRDYQRRHAWREYISDIGNREDELAGKTLGIIGMGHIGSRVAELGKAFGMRVIGTKRDASRYEGPADEVLPSSDGLERLLRESDYVTLNCPLTDDTRDIINERTLGMMKPTAYLLNMARGGCVDEPALLKALRNCDIAGAALDHFKEDPLPPESPFWDLDNAIITPHTAGETRRYEENVMDTLFENLDRLSRGETALLHQVV